MKNEIRNLVEKLNYYTDAYNEGTPLISDKQWDDLYFTLLAAEKETGIVFPDSPTQSIREVKSKLIKVYHTHLMLSLDKTKSINDIKSFVGDKKFICMGKLDGLTCSLRYENGKLVAAETRGDGTVGEDILANACRVKNIPLTIEYKDTLEIDGEIICTWKDFEKFATDYKNPRNFAAGSIRLLDPRESEKRNLTFVAWDWIGSPHETLGEELVELDKLGFDTVPYWDGIETKLDNLEEIIEEVKGFCQTWSYPIDGLVFKYDDNKEYEKAGRTSHHFRGGLALKFYDEDTESTVTGIEWTMGRTGCLTPVIEFEPIEIENTMVTRASAHNLSILTQLWGGTRAGRIGDKVKVVKANQIIPQVIEWIPSDEATEEIKYPALCPICGEKTSIHIEPSGVQTVWCDNPNCEGKFVNKLVHYCDMKKGMAIKGMSKATLEKLINKGWITTIEDIYKLHEYKDEWINMAGFGPQSVQNLLTAIENSKKAELWRFISALGIPLIGVSASHDLATACGAWAEFYKRIKENFIFYTIPNFGVEMDRSIHSYKDIELANFIATNYLTFTQEEKTSTEQTLEGITVAITGKLIQFKNREAFKQAIEDAGGKVTSSVSSKTNYLITNDTSSGSSKNLTAQKLGVEIISEADFIQKFLG